MKIIKFPTKEPPPGYFYCIGCGKLTKDRLIKADGFCSYMCIVTHNPAPKSS